ncbi:MAG: VWA domain-containing protein [Candidatus Omnitrophica bacterium]|nr:VWA domain-containing protein [Candidatus Omnitrophota bacterium]
MIFSDLWAVLLLLPVAAAGIWMFYRSEKNQAAARFSDTRLFTQNKLPKAAEWKRILPHILKVAALTLLVVCVMRPQNPVEESRIEAHGIDIMLSVDVSGSMQAEDFVIDGNRTNRLEVVKDAVREFIKKRKHDRIGIVVFAGSAYIQCPPTLDYGILMDFLDRLKIGMIEDGTAVGDGLTLALSKLKDLESRSKVVILLTDGVNNAGKVDPANAAELAKAVGVKVYTIGAGSKGRVPFPARDIFGNKAYQWAVIDLDEDSLKHIAEVTDGLYFRADSAEALKKVYDSIDQLEKSEIEMTLYGEYRELFVWPAVFAFVLLAVERMMSLTVLRRLL